MYNCIFVCLTLAMLVCNLPELHSEEIDISSAEKEGLVSVRFVASNEQRARFVIRNQTDKPLKIKLPTAFAAVPVLAQINGAGFNNGGIVPNHPQRLGGGFPQNNAFGVTPFGTIVVPVNTVCLDFGLPTPNTRTKFKIVSVDEVSYDSKVNNLLFALAEKRVPQKVAQIAIWNIHNGTSFRDIASTGFFSQSDVSAARSIIVNL